MTNNEYRKKYPIGTKIKFIGSVCADVGKLGSIVGIDIRDSFPIIYLPKSISQFPYKGGKCSWFCGWDEIEPLMEKNQQLLFSFMH